MSTPSPMSATDQPPGPAAVASAPLRGRPTAASLVGWSEIRSDLRSAVLLISALGLAGIPVGVLWWLLAPRLDFRITSAGPAPVDAVPSSEVLIADDGVFTLLLAAVGLLCGLLAWWMRRRRGVATVIALAAGTTICGALAWQMGEFLGAGPTRAEIAHVGGRVTTSLTLHSLPALAFGPFAAVLAYVVAVLYTRSDDLGRIERPQPVSPRAGEALDPVS